MRGQGCARRSTISIDSRRRHKLSMINSLPPGALFAAMMLLLRDDLVLETFDSPDDPPNWIEWIDVENHEYSFSDDRGQLYEGQLVRRSGLFKAEQWRLVPVERANISNATKLVDRAGAVDPDKCAFPDVGQSISGKGLKIDGNLKFP